MCWSSETHVALTSESHSSETIAKTMFSTKFYQKKKRETAGKIQGNNLKGLHKQMWPFKCAFSMENSHYVLIFFHMH